MESTILVFENIKVILENGLFPGGNAAVVAQAITFLSQLIEDAKAKAPVGAEAPVA